MSVVKVAIDTRDLHVVSDSEARRLFQGLLGTGTAWKSGLMQYRTTSSWQDDWVVEVGNWLARATTLGFLNQIVANVQARRTDQGRREAGDPVHRTVAHWLSHAMVAHYFAGIGWRFGASEPGLSDLRGDGLRADVDLQFYAPAGGPLVDLQVKASGTLGLHDTEADKQIRVGVRHAIEQLPDPALGPALVVVTAQRGWWLSGDTRVLESLIGSTSCDRQRRVFLHADAQGELEVARHVSAIVMLDYRRGLDDFDYSCSVLMNPWSYYPIDPLWFPHSRVLTCSNGVFEWLRGAPSGTYFPSGTLLTSCPRGSAL